MHLSLEDTNGGDSHELVSFKLHQGENFFNMKIGLVNDSTRLTGHVMLYAAAWMTTVEAMNRGWGKKCVRRTCCTQALGMNASLTGKCMFLDMVHQGIALHFHT